MRGQNEMPAYPFSWSLPVLVRPSWSARLRSLMRGKRWVWVNPTWEVTAHRYDGTDVYSGPVLGLAEVEPGVTYQMRSRHIPGYWDEVPIRGH